MYHQFNIQQFYVLPTQCIFVFCVDLRTNSHYFPYNINWLLFITNTQCVYCAVRTGSLTVIQFKFTVLAHPMTHTGTRRPLTLSVDLTLSPHKVPLWQMFVPALQHWHVTISPPVLYSSYLHVAFTWTRHRQSPETFQEAMFLRKCLERCIAKHFHFC